MKKLLLLLCLPIFTFAQQTYVPDDNFEQELIDLGIDPDTILNDYVPTVNIFSIPYMKLVRTFFFQIIFLLLSTTRQPVHGTNFSFNIICPIRTPGEF